MKSRPPSRRRLLGFQERPNHPARELKLPRVDLVELDIVGAERNALVGARTGPVRAHSGPTVLFFY
jgi:hypothetical protein